MSPLPLLGLVVIFVAGTQGVENSPPHCTVLTKDTDYVSKFRFDYPVAYIPQGQREAYQKMYCINPATVNKASATVCDWVSPPHVTFTLGDDYLQVVRQDPTGRFIGNAVITTYQLCQHNIPPHSDDNQTFVPPSQVFIS